MRFKVHPLLYIYGKSKKFRNSKTQDSLFLGFDILFGL